MVANINAKRPFISNGNNTQRSGKPHPLARFVTLETVAFLFNIKIEDIYRVECWPHIVYVHAVGVSRFVSYADFPPVVGTEPPVETEFRWWLRRWAKKTSKQAPDSWTRFYCQKFEQSIEVADLWQWGKLIDHFKHLLSIAAIETLRAVYQREKNYCENF